MVNNEIDRNLIRRYLLGVLDESGQQEFEQRLLTDERISEELQIIEEELTDEYLAEQLTPDERRHFEAHFLASPGRQEDLQFSRTFQQYVADAAVTSASETNVNSNNPVPQDEVAVRSFWQRPAFAYALVAASVLILSITSWLIWSSKQSPTRARIEQELAQLNEQNNAGQSTTGSASEIDKVRLTGGLVRGAGTTKTLQISAQSKLIEIELEAPTADYLTYEATVISEGTEMYSVPNLAPSPANGINIVRLHLLPKYLPSGDYQIKLSGKTADGKIESVGSYSFRVVLQ